MTAKTETTGGHVFATTAKSAAGYLDQGTNSHGAEKIGLSLRAITRAKADVVRMAEIGPGGGAALDYLTRSLSRATDRPRKLDITLIEAPGVISPALARAIDGYNAAGLGTCTLINGWAQDIGTILDRPVHIINSSAVAHEQFSYGGAYQELHKTAQTLPTLLTPGGHFAYRDVLSVNADTLHETVTQTYTHRGWLQFVRMFTPQYLRDAQHPYHRFSDVPIVRQDSRIVALEEIDPKTSAVITGPIGLFREIQRHYITFRKDVLRSGALGFLPHLEGQHSADWINAASGHKRVHFTLTEWISPRNRALQETVREPYGDHWVMDGDRFDDCTDLAIIDLLTAAENGDERCAAEWRKWIESEGHETYAYLTVSELLTEFAISSAEANTNTVLLPQTASDVLTPERATYNRYLRNRLSDPLPDGKQLVLFTNVPVSDTKALTDGIEIIQNLCGRAASARLHTALAQMM